MDGDLSGALIQDGDEVYIGVNSLQSRNRRRFTIAHELGHFVLHEGIYVDKDFRINWRDGNSSKAANPDEMEANRFAAELLMPTDLLVRDIESLRRVDPAALESLARRYRVSSHAMRIRLGNFGLNLPD
jgi:Zn-dependent peptidase ImmA (M78 family)